MVVPSGVRDEDVFWLKLVGEKFGANVVGTCAGDGLDRGDVTFGNGC